MGGVSWPMIKGVFCGLGYTGCELTLNPKPCRLVLGLGVSVTVQGLATRTVRG